MNIMSRPTYAYLLPLFLDFFYNYQITSYNSTVTWLCEALDMNYANDPQPLYVNLTKML
jgi:hypothetical protein